ncbi:MAG TPA: hypothetical protein VI790_03685 [Candidatus Nanoarchaeia archaeon]|nr:hypothetical protein [Candidatus Nanoarchaeia archaeon]
MSFIKKLSNAVFNDYGNVKVYEFDGSSSLDSALAKITGVYPDVGLGC